MQEAKIPALLNRAAAYLKLVSDNSAALNAIKDCEEVLKVEPANAKASMRIGQAHLNRSDHRTAQHTPQIASACHLLLIRVMHCSRTSFYSLVCVCRACSGECEDALPFLTRAQAQLPEDKGLAALITKTKRTINEAEKKQAKQFSKMFA